MLQTRIQTIFMTVAFAATALLQIACETQETPSGTIGGITFAQDYDDERRVLRIELSPLQVAQCMQSALPVGTNAPWKEGLLDAGLHRRLIQLLSDEARIPYYEADTNVAVEVETFICNPTSNNPEFCYVPEVVVSGVNAPWRFALQEDVTLSTEGRELIEQFQLAHDACWNGEGLPTNGGIPTP